MASLRRGRRHCCRTGFKPVFDADEYDFCVTLWNMNRSSAEQAGPQVSPQVERLLDALGEREMPAAEIMEALGFSDRKSFRGNYLSPALEAGPPR